MIEILVLVGAVFALWLFVSLLGLMLKLVFGVVGGLFGLLGVLIGGVVALGVGLALVPLMLIALMPFLVPTLLLAGLVWLIVRASSPSKPPQATTH